MGIQDAEKYMLYDPHIISPAVKKWSNVTQYPIGRVNHIIHGNFHVCLVLVISSDYTHTKMLCTTNVNYTQFI